MEKFKQQVGILELQIKNLEDLKITLEIYSNPKSAYYNIFGTETERTRNTLITKKSISEAKVAVKMSQVNLNNYIDKLTNETKGES